ncbi:unnamed protein product [Camellia sinensis]
MRENLLRQHCRERERERSWHCMAFNDIKDVNLEITAFTSKELVEDGHWSLVRRGPDPITYVASRMPAVYFACHRVLSDHDLVIVSYVLGEIASPQDKITIVRQLWDLSTFHVSVCASLCAEGKKQMPSLRIIYTRADPGSGWGRIIHTPIRRGKRVEMDVCCATNRDGSEGLFERIVITQSKNPTFQHPARWSLGEICGPFDTIL